MKITSFVFAGVMLAATSLYAANTDMTSKWVCTTNASSSDVESDKAADKQMADTARSADEAFNFAGQHCRDCTKITCEVKE
ncbi:hypothetical protein DIZ81_12060 [Legionella taurinensis]|uniref:Uncharacterized protein n=1 Tax=Legionella taurinensis TaxID=70611 RepID=A0A3A5L571_9GAMM|nr:hypothetical protein [Legionella taurinensis]MDX1838475.1 hypothetical protein [Legionella taurinensis]PUT38918.1 hypothetical protein DB744_12070 [Legionella taurinensis]PUT40979.1 hypothetical protein DB746_10465 [Legionella taurinensis]PUT43211.1 hypothetical protein DB743_11465 [Legionella taurinensis]PUT46397.1 hypothetical protein DB745_10950 [Legionella taurinensis]